MHLAANVHTVEDEPVLAHNVNFAAHELPLQLVEGAEMHGTMRAVLRRSRPPSKPEGVSMPGSPIWHPLDLNVPTANLNVPTAGWLHHLVLDRAVRLR